MGTIIILDVDETLFKITQTTLELSYYFKMMLSDVYKERLDRPIFINRSPEGFRHILDFLRDNNYKIPSTYEYELNFVIIILRILYSKHLHVINVMLAVIMWKLNVQYAIHVINISLKNVVIMCCKIKLPVVDVVCV